MVHIKKKVFKDICTLMFTTALCITVKNTEAVQAPINSWMDKEDIIYTHTHTHTQNGIHINHKKE